jgi:hypothetical protein
LGAMIKLVVRKKAGWGEKRDEFGVAGVTYLRHAPLFRVCTEM